MPKEAEASRCMGILRDHVGAHCHPLAVSSVLSSQGSRLQSGQAMLAGVVAAHGEWLPQTESCRLRWQVPIVGFCLHLALAEALSGSPALQAATSSSGHWVPTCGMVPQPCEPGPVGRNCPQEGAESIANAHFLLRRMGG